MKIDIVQILEESGLGEAIDAQLRSTREVAAIIRAAKLPLSKCTGVTVKPDP